LLGWFRSPAGGREFFAPVGLRSLEGDCGKCFREGLRCLACVVGIVARDHLIGGMGGDLRGKSARPGRAGHLERVGYVPLTRRSLVRFFFVASIAPSMLGVTRRGSLDRRLGALRGYFQYSLCNH
jgi:hypothetical protein